MTIERIKEIQQETDYPNSISVQQALLKVWNECSQEYKKGNNSDFKSQIMKTLNEDNEDLKTFGFTSKEKDWTYESK